MATVYKLSSSANRKAWDRVSHEMVFGEPARYKNLYRVKMSYSETAPDLYYSVDDAAWVKAVARVSPSTVYYVSELNLKGVKFKFRISGSADTIVHAMDIQYRVAGRI